MCRGISHDKLGDYAAAIADFQRVIELDPTNANAFFNLASSFDVLGRYDEAIFNYGRALELDRQATS